MARESLDDVILNAEVGGIARSGVLWRPWTIALDRAIGLVVDPICSLLIVVEVAILASGVFSRYVLHNALVWSDELATIIFLWIAMLGAVSAMRSGTHMRLSIIAGRSGPVRSRWFDAISSVIVGLFCLEMIVASREVFVLEMIDLTPALNIPRSWSVAPIIIAMALILTIAIVRLIDSDRKVVGVVLACALVVVLGVYFGRGVFSQLGNLNLVLFFVVFVGALIAIGVPIAFCFGAGTLSFLAITTTVPLPVVVNRMEEGISNIVLLAIPLFVLLGLLMTNAGIAVRLVNAIASVVGHLRGGLGIVLIFAMYLVSGISGSKSADMAAVAPVLFPEMRRRGMILGELVSLLNASASMAETIPPALVLIIIGSVTGVSIASLFTAGLMPATVAAIFLLAVTLWRARNDRSELAQRPVFARIAKYFWLAIPGLALPLLIRAFVLGGVATATEVSTVGIIYTLLIGALVYRELDWKRIYPQLRETGVLTGAIMLIIATATAMAWALTQSGFAQQLANAVEKAPGGAASFMALSCVLFIVLGSVLEGIPAIVLFGPLLFPIAAAYHIDQIQYAIVVVLSMGIGLHAPPVGVGYYAACIIGKASPDESMGRAFPYLAAIAVALIFVAAVPWLSLGFLPKVH